MADVRKPPEARNAALLHEVEFWRRWFSSRGLKWPEDYKRRLDPNQPLQQYVAEFVDRVEADPVRILDVGAGPITKLGKMHPLRRIAITATDLLAPEYDVVLREYGIDPIIPTIFADAENLVAAFAADSFDIVHGQNCIDHTVDPLRSITQMVGVTRPGGFTVLLHDQNEGMNESSRNLHQGDFSGQDGRFIIRGPGPDGERIDATRALSSLGRVEVTLSGGEIPEILVSIHKHR
jgi:SAM-dependent methyltransferase